MRGRGMGQLPQQARQSHLRVRVLGAMIWGSAPKVLGVYGFGLQGCSGVNPLSSALALRASDVERMHGLLLVLFLLLSVLLLLSL